MNEFSYEIVENITNGGGRIRTASPPGVPRSYTRSRGAASAAVNQTNQRTGARRHHVTKEHDRPTSQKSSEVTSRPTETTTKLPPMAIAARVPLESHTTVARRHFALHTARRSCRTAQADPILARTRSQHAQHAAKRTAPTTESTNVALAARRLPMLRPQPTICNSYVWPLSLIAVREQILPRVA